MGRVDDQRATVLVVEDHPDSLEFLRMLFEGEGVQVVSAHDGKDALSKVQAIVPSLVITDVRLPEVGGLELIRQIKANTATRGIPVIALSASPSLGASAFEAGASAFLEKPFDIDHLLQKAAAFLPSLRLANPA